MADENFDKFDSFDNISPDEFENEDIVESDKNEENTTDFEELKKLILDGKTNDNVNKEKDKEGLIGWFYLGESEMECHSFKRKYGTIVGNLIIGNPNIIGMKLDKVSGFVSYDCFEDCYYITCDRVLHRNFRYLN